MATDGTHADENNFLSVLSVKSVVQILWLRNWIGIMAAFSFFKISSIGVAQDDNAAKTNSSTNTLAETTLEKKPSKLRLGPFDLHPRLSTGLTYDDNILLSTANKEADTEWVIQPALQAVAGDDAALIAYRDQHNDVLSLSPGNLIIQQPEDRPGKLLLLDYGPGFQVFDKYSANNSIDEFATLSLLWPMEKLILGLRQDYSLQKTDLIEFDQRATVESIPTTLSAAYQFGDKTSIESDFRRISIGYEAPGLIGYTEFNSEDWFNYKLEEDLTASLGVLAGVDEVANQQDQTFEQLRARARYNYTEKLTFDASVGAELRQFENGLPEKVSPVFTIAGDYRLAERTSLRLSGSRQVYAAIFSGYNYSITGAALEVRQGITDRFTATLSAGYYSIDYTPITRALTEYTGDYYIARISLEAKLLRHLTGQIFYQLISSHSQISAGIDDNQAGVQLTESF
jgi:hypothetical protein